MNIEYRIGDATDPPERPVIIAHVCNDVGAFGRGFAAALMKRFPDTGELAKPHPTPDSGFVFGAHETYKRWSMERESFGLGKVGTFIVGGYRAMNFGVAEQITLAHMCAQRGLPSRANPHPLDLFALEMCLWRLRMFAGSTPIVMPRIGTGFGGAKWSEIEPILKRTLSERRVIVYDLPRSTP